MSSIKTKFVFQFDEDFCNEHKQLIDSDESAIKCYTCSQYFKRGDWIFSSPTLKRRMKRRHLACALRINLAPQKYSKYLNAFYLVGIAVWVTEITRHFIIGSA